MTGEGGLDLLFLTGWITQIEQLWEEPANRRFLERLSAFGRLILFDSRGTGLSERLLEEYTVEQEARDALAVLDAAGSERAALITYAQGGLVGAQLAADHPERIGALIMYASVARTSWAPDYDWAMPLEERQALSERNIATWGEDKGEMMKLWAPTMAEDPGLVAWFARMQRLAASPAEARVIARAMIDLDVREVLPRIRVPTLVMHRPKERVWDVRHSRYLAENIAGARYVELDGIDSFPFVGDSDAIVEEIEEFLTGGRRGGELARALLTVMFTDIVDATARAAELGDGRWRDLLARHDEQVRRQLERFDGREVKTVGDGFLATFDGPPSRALRCALAITERRASAGDRGPHRDPHRRVRADRRRRRRDGRPHRLARQRARRRRRGARLGDRLRDRRGRAVRLRGPRLPRAQGRSRPLAAVLPQRRGPAPVAIEEPAAEASR